MKHFIILFLMLSIAFTNTYGQKMETDSSQVIGRKNVVYGTVGFVPLYIVTNISYERRIAANSSKFIRSYWLKASGGVWGGWAVGGPHFLAGITALSGSGNSHLEFNLGFVSLYDKKSYDDIYAIRSNESVSRSDYIKNSIAGGIGYRYQSPNDWVVFRAGLSYPESIYISLGVVF